VPGPDAGYQGFAVPSDACGDASTSIISAPEREKPERVPPFMFRLKTCPIVYFVRLTRSFNRTMLRLKRMKIERRR
jgi:hypothetical protein